MEIIGGISTTLFQGKRKGTSGDKFKTVLEKYYPWDLEGCLDSRQSTEDLYDFFRNPLAHNLGMKNKKTKKDGRYNIGIGKQSFPEDRLEKFELSETPPFKNTTLRLMPDINTLKLSVEQLYWGVRVMITRLTDDAAMMTEAEDYLTTVLK